jgi:hypothetical protein
MKDFFQLFLEGCNAYVFVGEGMCPFFGEKFKPFILFSESDIFCL